MTHARIDSAVTVVALLLVASSASAQDSVTVDEVRLDRPTPSSLGVQVLISGDENGDATADLFYRAAGEEAYRAGLPMLRVLPDTVVGMSVPDQLAGSAVHLTPSTDYELQIRVTDPDGGDVTRDVTATTRRVPRRDPSTPRTVLVASASELQAALQNAQAGDVIEVTAGTYTGSFSLNASGTADDPIVIRGADRDDAIFDGGDCGCNVFEVYGSFTHLENLTIRNAVRAVRFLGEGASNNVARDLRIENVVHGIGSRADQRDFYICDNIVHGRLDWPLVSSDDGAQHNDDQGVRVDGDGHVVCHNEISGFGDPILNFADGHRGFDVYGNEVFDIYGDGIEIDRAAGNARVYDNRWTNVYTAISMQPIHGGPAYVFRNVVVNVADEQLKLKSVGGDVEPSGALIFHNTFVSPAVALNLQTPITQYNFRIENNLFIGPETTERGFTVDWTATIEGGLFDYNGYFPDGKFWFGKTPAGDNQSWDDFAGVQAAGVYETNGRIVEASPFATGLEAPGDYRTRLEPQDLTPDADSAAVDAARTIPGISDLFAGDAPDIGAVEHGCGNVIYGPRSGSDETGYEPPCADDPTSPGDDDAGSTGMHDAGPTMIDGGDGIPTNADGGDMSSSDAGVDAGGPGDESVESDGCGCNSSPAGILSWLSLLGLVGLLHRRTKKWRRR